MDLLSRSTFGVARVFMAMAVFFCHVFQPLNRWGFFLPPGLLAALLLFVVSWVLFLRPVAYRGC